MPTPRFLEGLSLCSLKVRHQACRNRYCASTQDRRPALFRIYCVGNVKVDGRPVAVVRSNCPWGTPDSHINGWPIESACPRSLTIPLSCLPGALPPEIVGDTRPHMFLFTPMSGKCPIFANDGSAIEIEPSGGPDNQGWSQKELQVVVLKIWSCDLEPIHHSLKDRSARSPIEFPVLVVCSSVLLKHGTPSYATSHPSVQQSSLSRSPRLVEMTTLHSTWSFSFLSSSPPAR